MQNKMPILCLDCGEAAAKKVKHTIAPLNKSNYMVFTDTTLLKQLNPKVTTWETVTEKKYTSQ